MTTKPVTVDVRNHSLDDLMTVLIDLKSELTSIGTNYNQLTNKLHALQQTAEIKTWVVLHNQH